MQSKTSRKDGKILGVRVDGTPKARVLRVLQAKVARNQKFFVVSPNPEIVMQAQNDPLLAKILNSADLSIADGVGLAAASRFLRLPSGGGGLEKFLTLFAQGLGVGFSIIFDRKWLFEDFKLVKGRELFSDLIFIANKKGWKVVLLGDRMQSAQKAAEKLGYNFKKIKIFASDGPNLDKDGLPQGRADAEIQKTAIVSINKIFPQLLFVGFGAPKQEKWVYKYLPRLRVGGAMVVGGAFDYVSGKAELPPRWMAESGLEWLWRLFREPKRARRILRATVLFCLEVFKQKWNS